MRTVLSRILVASAVVLLSPIAAANQFPSKPVHLIVPWPAGGIVDVIARAVAEKVSGNWGTTIVVENKPGAGGLLGYASAAAAAPDGYTWLMATQTFTVVPHLYKHIRWHPTKDFTGAAMICTQPRLTAVVPSSSPAKNLKEFVSLAKDRPGEFTYVNAGVGSSVHLLSELFKTEAAFDMRSILYKGQPQGLLDLLAGRVSFAVMSEGLTLPHVKGSKLRALAISGRNRSPNLPSVPTFSEAGYPEADVAGWGWYSIVVPKGTPRGIVTRINAEINKALSDPGVRRRIEAAMADPAQTSTPEETHNNLEKDYTYWGRFIKEAGIEAQ